MFELCVAWDPSLLAASLSLLLFFPLHFARLLLPPPSSFSFSNELACLSSSLWALCKSLSERAVANTNNSFFWWLFFHLVRLLLGFFLVVVAAQTRVFPLNHQTDDFYMLDWCRKCGILAFSARVELPPRPLRLNKYSLAHTTVLVYTNEIIFMHNKSCCSIDKNKFSEIFINKQRRVDWRVVFIMLDERDR